MVLKLVGYNDQSYTVKVVISYGFYVPKKDWVEVCNMMRIVQVFMRVSWHSMSMSEGTTQLW